MPHLLRSVRRGAVLLSLLPAFALAQQPLDAGMPPPHGCARADGPHHGRPHLDEAQQDKLFALRHEQEPQQRTLHKQADKARMALHELARSGQYSDAKAKPIADSLAQAEAGLALMRARFESQLLQILTPQQREQMRQPGCGPARGAGGPEHGPWGGRGMRGAAGPDRAGS